jgi:PTH1 family peptidyl-tRNA hydrolase
MSDAVFRNGPPDATATSISGILVGLGNPGPRYRDTLHNLGFAAIRALAERLAAPAFYRVGLSRITQTCSNDRRLLLAEPATFMNRSGFAVAELLNAAPEAELIVVHDDLDLEFGRLRLKRGGGSGGHNGLNSIIETLGHGDFARLRIGIGRPPPDQDPAEFVLAPLDEAPREAMEEAARRAAEALVLALELGVGRAMSTVNRRAPPSGESPPGPRDLKKDGQPNGLGG